MNDQSEAASSVSFPSGIRASDPGVVFESATADSNTVPGALARIPNGRDTDDAAADWAFTSAITQGAANVP